MTLKSHNALWYANRCGVVAER